MSATHLFHLRDMPADNGKAGFFDVIALQIRKSSGRGIQFNCHLSQEHYKLQT